MPGLSQGTQRWSKHTRTHVVRGHILGRGRNKKLNVESTACETEAITKEKNKAEERGKAEGLLIGDSGAKLRGGDPRPGKW